MVHGRLWFVEGCKDDIEGDPPLRTPLFQQELKTDLYKRLADSFYYKDGLSFVRPPCNTTFPLKQLAHGNAWAAIGIVLCNCYLCTSRIQLGSGDSSLSIPSSCSLTDVAP